MDLQAASPYPKDLFQPYFALCDIGAEKFYETGKVAKYRIADNFEAVLFKRKGLSAPDKPVCLIGTLSLNRWRSRITLQMELEYLE